MESRLTQLNLICVQFFFVISILTITVRPISDLYHFPFPFPFPRPTVVPTILSLTKEQ